MDSSNLAAAAAAIEKVRRNGGGLFIMTGAGMSVASGVPVFRGSDGSMSPDFLRFLAGYNAARKRAGLPEVDDWFGFSVPEMFARDTAKEAWDYWRWRTLRALVEPGGDYVALMKLVERFGRDRCFVETSNCDSLHFRAGLDSEKVYEIHGSLSRLQCSTPCNARLLPADATFLKRLEEEPDWVPMCEMCGSACLRPNVKIFGDFQIETEELDAQRRRRSAFLESFSHGGEKSNFVVLEIGAGTVVPSIRCGAERIGARAEGGLVRINPSKAECAELQTGSSERLKAGVTYLPLAVGSEEALTALCGAVERLAGDGSA